MLLKIYFIINKILDHKKKLYMIDVLYLTEICTKQNFRKIKPKYLLLTLKNKC